MPTKIANAFTRAGRLAQFYRFNLHVRFYLVLNNIIAISALRQAGHYIFNAKQAHTYSAVGKGLNQA